MKTLSFYTSVALLTAFAAGSALAKDDKKDKDKDRDRDRGDAVDRNGPGPRERTRTIYVVERDRPVERVVSVDGDGRYFRWQDGRRVYIRERYFESYPSKYYYPDGRRRVTITLPF